MDFPRLRSRPAPKSRRGRFLFSFSATPVGLFGVSAASIWASIGETLDSYSVNARHLFVRVKYTYSSEDILETMRGGQRELRHTA